ncbi:MAG: hypothetical protein R2773_03015 [Flavobacteriaceae bacterium]
MSTLVNMLSGSSDDLPSFRRISSGKVTYWIGGNLRSAMATAEPQNYVTKEELLLQLNERTL